MIETVKKRLHSGERPFVIAGGLGMADADPDQDPTGKAGFELGEVVRHLFWVARPDVEDPGGDRDALGRLQQRPERRQLRRTPPAGTFPKPQILGQACRLAAFSSPIVR